MHRPRRRELLLAIAGAALLSPPGGTRGTRLADAIGPSQYATVGRVASRRVDGRTIVLIPVAGVLRPRLSEPFRVRSRWRLYLTLEGAHLGVNARPRPGEGVLGIDVAEIGSEVRVAVDVASLTSYGTRPSAEGLLLWIEDERTEAHRAEEQANALPVIGDGPRVASQLALRPDPQQGGGSGLFVALASAVALLVGVRWWRRNGGSLPGWVVEGSARLAGTIMAKVRHKILPSATDTEDAPGKDTPASDGESVSTELRKTG